jgi:hypothetical protein
MSGRSLAVTAGLGLWLAWPGLLPAREGPQPPLPTITLAVRQIRIITEVADEEHERQAGLMYREKLEDGKGMLFVMPRVGPAAFWMKNTILPLSIAYISPSGLILEIHDLEPGVETPVASRLSNVAYALEVRRDWFSDVGILPGDRITGLPPPSTDQQP